MWFKKLISFIYNVLTFNNHNKKETKTMPDVKRFDVEVSLKVKGDGVESYESISKYNQTTKEKVILIEKNLGEAQFKFLAQTSGDLATLLKD